MNHTQSFFKDIKSSFYDPAFYGVVPVKPVSNAIFFLFWVSVISALCAMVFISVSAFTTFKSFSANDFVSKNYPEALVVTIKDGKASVNQPEPYMIPANAEMKNDKDHPYDNFLVIDTRPETTLETLNSYKSFAVLTSDRVFFAADNKDGRVFSLTSVKELTVDRNTAVSWVGKLIGILWIVALPLALFGVLAIAVFSLVFHLIASLVGALLVILVGMVRKNKLEYGDAYKIALYASVPVIFVQTLAMFFHVSSLPFFLDVLLFIIVLFANLTPKVDTAPTV